MRRTRLSIAAVVLTAAAFVFGAADVERAAAEKMQINVPALNANFSPFFAALDKGYFAEEGLEVELPVIGGGTAVPALIAGNLIYSSSPSSAMSAILKGAPLTVVLVGQSRPIYQLWSFDPAVKRFEDLKGKVVAVVTRGATEEISIRMMLKARNLPLDFVGFTTTGPGPVRMAAVASGSQKFLMLTRVERGTLAANGLLAQGTMLVDASQQVELQTGGLVTTSKELAENRTRAKRVLRALWKGTLYMHQQQDGMADLLQKRLPQTARDVIRRDVEGGVEDLDEDGMLSLEAQVRELAVRGEILDIAPGKIPEPAKVYDFSVIREVAAELKAANWKPTR
jgi:NitT/TauT family transport system substrate-binding protein